MRNRVFLKLKLLSRKFAPDWLWRFLQSCKSFMSLRAAYAQKLRRIQSTQQIKLFFWRPENHINFGDEFGPEIIERLFGYRVEHVADILRADMISVGSILQLLADAEYETGNHDRQVDVWGSGYINDEEGPRISDGTKIHAVRGRITRDRLGTGHHKVVLGDPALLASLVYESSHIKTGKVGVIPHYVDADDPIVKRMKKDDRFLIIDVMQEPQHVIFQITQCDLILSSSLHGLIASDSFGVPNIHIKLSKKLVGEEYKFHDYYSATNKKYEAADLAQIFNTKYLNNIKKMYQPIEGLRGIQQALIGSFPYKIYKPSKKYSHLN